MAPTFSNEGSATSTDSSRLCARAVHRGAIRKVGTMAHRWIGLLAGVYFVIAGLTGGVLAFWQDLDEWLNRDLMLVEPPALSATYRSADEIISAARALLPEEAKARPDTPLAVLFPRHRAAAVRVDYITGVPSKALMDEAMKTMDFSKLDLNAVANHSIFVNPYTARVTGERFAGWNTRPTSRPFVYMIMSVHCALLWEPFGRLAMALVGLALLISTVAGIWLWWQRLGSWAKALRIKRGAKPERLVYDVHKACGVYLGVVLIVSIFSGTYMNFKAPWRALVSLLSPVRQLKMSQEFDPPDGRSPLTASEAIAVVDKVFPDGWLQQMILPRGERGVYVIGKHLDGEVNQASTLRMLIVDQYSGKILAMQDPRQFSAGEKFFEWQYPLHSGEAFGGPGRAFMLAFGFVPLALYATGFIRWRHKSRNQRARRLSEHQEVED